MINHVDQMVDDVWLTHKAHQGPHWAGSVAGTASGDITTAFTAVTGRAPSVGDHVSFYDSIGTAYHLYVYASSDWRALV